MAGTMHLLGDGRSAKDTTGGVEEDGVRRGGRIPAEIADGERVRRSSNLSESMRVLACERG